MRLRVDPHSQQNITVSEKIFICIMIYFYYVFQVMKRMSELATEFSSNLGEDTTVLEFSRDELKGVPEDLLNSFEKVK